MAIDSLKAIGQVTKATAGVNTSYEKLGSGKRINSAKDDPAGSAIAANLDAVVVILGQASRNTSDSSSAIQIADSAVASIGDIRTRQAELATQAGNGTLNDSQRAAISEEVGALSQEADRIVATTEFNGQKLLQGSSSTAQVGTDSSAGSQITTPAINVSSPSLDTASQASALLALDSINQSISSISQIRGQLGASESRLDVAQSNIASSKENNAAASARIQDLDVADETSKLKNSQIRQSISTNSLKQANESQQNILKLLSA